MVTDRRPLLKAEKPLPPERPTTSFSQHTLPSKAGSGSVVDICHRVSVRCAFSRCSWSTCGLHVIAPLLPWHLDRPTTPAVTCRLHWSLQNLFSRRPASVFALPHYWQKRVPMLGVCSPLSQCASQNRAHLVHLTCPLLNTSGYFSMALIAQLSKKLFWTRSNTSAAYGSFYNFCILWNANWKGMIVSTNNMRPVKWSWPHSNSGVSTFSSRSKSYDYETDKSPSAPWLRWRVLCTMVRAGTRCKGCTLTSAGCSFSFQRFEMALISREENMFWLEILSSQTGPLMYDRPVITKFNDTENVSACSTSSS